MVLIFHEKNYKNKLKTNDYGDQDEGKELGK